MTQKINKNKEIIIPIFNDLYKVIVCWGGKKFINNIGKSWGYLEGGVILKDDSVATTCYHNGNHPIIVLSGPPKTNDLIGTLAHEAVHAMNHIYNYIAEENTDEVYAHSVGAIVRITLQNK